MRRESLRTDKMTLAAFASASTNRGNFGAWTHPATDLGILDANYYINLGRSVERYGFDILFFDDRLAMPAVYGDSPAEAVRLGSRAVKLDLISVLSIISTHTSRIGLGATYSTTYHAPFHIARAFATLDHLSGGRAVWNIVTSLNRNEAENFGVPFKGADDRYDRADEFLEVVSGLWETWERDALKLDRETGIYADPEKVHELNFEGKFLSARGPLTVPQTPQGWPILLQAGQSGRGMTFAGRWADLIFTGPRNLEGAIAHYKKQAQSCEDAGRSAGAARILPAVQVMVGETAEMAQSKRAYFHTLGSMEEELVLLSEMANFDFSQLPLDEPLPDNLLEAVEGGRGLLQRYVEGARAKFGPLATLRQMAQNQHDNGLVQFVGTPSQVADGLCEWFEAHACDGFAIVPSDDPGSFEDFGRLVIPELRRRGVVPEMDGSGQTLRDRLGLPWRASR
jgi:FMN-dependent oxidoreductase (nitrilotriacetate monooxygenase family)